jgi:hypothetical protein
MVLTFVQRDEQNAAKSASACLSMIIGGETRPVMRTIFGRMAMALMVFQGNKGAGKTCMMTMLAKQGADTGRKIFSNYLVSFPHEPIKLQFLMDNPDILKKWMLLVDEATLWTDCRDSGSEKNKIFSYLMLQARHRFIDVMMTTQQVSMLDIRIRRNMDYLYSCEAWKCDTSIAGGLRRATIEEIDGRMVDRIFVRRTDYTQEVETAFIFNPAPIFPLYDSDEWIALPDFETKGERAARLKAEEKAKKTSRSK